MILTHKPWYKSKTILLNSVAAVVAAVPQIMPEIRSISVEWYIGLSIALPVINVYLRSITTQPIRTQK